MNCGIHYSIIAATEYTTRSRSVKIDSLPKEVFPKERGQIGLALHQSGEDYLEAILLLQKEKGMVRSVDVARYMEVSKPSVCHAVATLKEGGFLTIDGDFFLRLTDIGREVAEQTYEKHCFFTRLLVEAGVEPKAAERDACRMEHVISENSFRHLKQSIDKKK